MAPRCGSTLAWQGVWRFASGGGVLEGVVGVLAFIVTALAVVGGAVLILFALFRGRPGRALRIARVLLAWIGVYAACLVALSLTSRPRFIERGGERCFDEMCYSVQDVTVSPTAGDATLGPGTQGSRYVIVIRLRSAARRTAQRPSLPDLFVVDARGRRFTQFVNAGILDGFAPGQPVTARDLWNEPIGPGEEVLRTVAIDLPPGVQHPGLVITEGLGPLSAVVIGDEASVFHAHTQFILPP